MLNAQNKIQILDDFSGRTWGFDLLEPLTEDFLTSHKDKYWAQQKFKEIVKITKQIEQNLACLRVSLLSQSEFISKG